MLSNEFINEIVAENTSVVSAEELDELEFDTFLNSEYAETSECAVSLIEDLEYNGFTAKDIKQLFDGRCMKDGGMWGMIPHKARLYTSDYKDYYILIVEVAG